MKNLILKVVEGKGKTGEAKNGKKRFLFTDDSIDKFNSFCNDYYKEFKTRFPDTKLCYNDIRNQWLKIVLVYQDSEIMDYECEEVQTNVRIANMTKLKSFPYLNIDEYLNKAS